jgi:polyisoprenoid-binding protein YceI
MKTTKMLFGILTVGVLLTACGGNSTPSDEGTTMEVETTSQTIESTIDLEKSTIRWKGEMLGMYAHEGTLNFKSGQLHTAGGQLTGGEFEVDMTTITPTDENYMPEDGKTPEKLVGHLSSPDFFDVSTHPTATFEITGVNGSTVNGKLTIRGITKEETIENVTATTAGTTTTWSGQLTFDRKGYEVAFDHPVKEMVLSNDIALTVNVSADISK